PDTYFPGYGYAEPGYVYRKGEELSKETLSVFWKKIERTLEAGKKYNMLIEVGMTAQLGGSASIVELGTVNVNVGGSMKEMMQIEVTAKETVKTICTVKFQKDKVWFNLYRAQETWWGMSHADWEQIGKTYTIMEEESGLPVIETPDQPSPKSLIDREYYPGYGYGDPDFVYRLGEELDVQLLSTYWKRVEKIFSSEKKHKLLIEVGLQAQLGANASIVEIGTVTANIGGNMKELMEIEVTFKDETRTICTVKFQNQKVWFKLFRAKKELLGATHGDWEECGKSYEIKEEETGLPVIETPGQVSPYNMY
ncbi:MAG: hypothetical protein PHQ23_03310, partial [Candidatus Wallbacteria bacterium]|nr:hypothetical protein [Candidatus Wallbacteria bacterium]